MSTHVMKFKVPVPTVEPEMKEVSIEFPIHKRRAYWDTDETATRNGEVTTTIRKNMLIYLDPLNIVTLNKKEELNKRSRESTTEWELQTERLKEPYGLSTYICQSEDDQEDFADKAEWEKHLQEFREWEASVLASLILAE